MVVSAFTLSTAQAASGDSPTACHGIAGAQFNRYIWDAASGNLRQDGVALASVGVLCGVLRGDVYALELGGSAGMVVDSAMFENNRATLGVNIGIDYDGLVSVGLAPHWVTREPISESTSYGVGAFVAFRLGAWTDSIARMFSDGLESSFAEGLGHTKASGAEPILISAPDNGEK